MSTAAAAPKRAPGGPTLALPLPGQQTGQHSRAASHAAGTAFSAGSPRITHSRNASHQLPADATAAVAAEAISFAAQTAVAAAAGGDSSRPQLPPRPPHLRAPSHQQSQQQPQRPSSPAPHAEESDQHPENEPSVQHRRGASSVDRAFDVGSPAAPGHARVGSRAIVAYTPERAAPSTVEAAGQLGGRLEAELENADEDSVGCWGTVVKYWNYMITSIHEFVMSNPLIALVSAVVFAVFGISQLLPTIVAAIITGIPLICFSTLIFINIIQHNQDFSNSLALQIEGKHVTIDRVKKAIDDSPLKDNPGLQRRASLRSLGTLNFDEEAGSLNNSAASGDELYGDGKREDPVD